MIHAPFPQHPALMRKLLNLVRRDREGRRTGLPELDLPPEAVGIDSDECAGSRVFAEHVDVVPTAVELEILDALAQVVGEDFLEESKYLIVLRIFSQNGGVGLMHRVLWGQSKLDRRLTLYVRDAMPRLKAIVDLHPDEFLSQAKGALAPFMFSS